MPRPTRESPLKPKSRRQQKLLRRRRAPSSMRKPRRRPEPTRKHWQRRTRKRKTKREPPQPKSVLTGAYAVVYAEATNGNRGGGAWGACWRNDLGAARQCAKAGCERSRTSDQPCQEIASSSPGGHCAVARATGYGVSW